jgi:CRISPR-associated protein Cas1
MAIDLSVLQLLEEKKLERSDFILTDNYHLRLKPATARMLVEKIRLNMGFKVPYRYGEQFTYQTILLDCVQVLANFVIGKHKELQLNIPSMKMRRSDPLELRQIILGISAPEKKTRPTEA